MSQNFILPGLIEPLSSLASQSTFCSVLVLWDHVTNTRREAPSGKILRAGCPCLSACSLANILGGCCLVAQSCLTLLQPHGL